MKFLGKILERPPYERPFVVIPVGYPSEDCTVPAISRKKLDRIMTLDRGSPLREPDSEEPLPNPNARD